MASDLRAILSLEVPLIVLLGERLMRTSDVISLIPGAIMELSRGADEELTLLVNNRAIGTGVAVKVGENFGIKITYIGDLKSRIAALGEGEEHPEAAATGAAAANAL